MLCEYNIRGALQLAIDSSIACRRADGPYIFRSRLSTILEFQANLTSAVLAEHSKFFFL